MSKIKSETIKVDANLDDSTDFSELLQLLEKSDEEFETGNDAASDGEVDVQMNWSMDLDLEDEDACGDTPFPAMKSVVLEQEQEDDAFDQTAEIALDDFDVEMIEEEKPFELTLPEGMLPGALEMVLVTPEEEEVRPLTWSEDGAHNDFLDYMGLRLRSIPTHSGQTTVGCEKAISYLKKLDKEISKAIQSDDDNVIDESEAEKLRDIILDYIDKLEEAYGELSSKKRRKKRANWSLGKTVVARIGDTEIQYYASVVADNNEEKLLKVDVVEPSDSQVSAFMKPDNDGLTKEAGQLVTYVDPFIDSITRLIIRSHITHGKDIREVYAQLDAQYEFTSREELSIHEVLKQKGIGGTGLHVDLGRLQEPGANQFDGKGIEFGTTYYA